MAPISTHDVTGLYMSIRIDCTCETNTKNGDGCVVELLKLETMMAMFVCACLVVHCHSRCSGTFMFVVEKNSSHAKQDLQSMMQCPCMLRLKSCKAIKWSGDKTCDDENNHAGCSWDGTGREQPRRQIPHT